MSVGRLSLGAAQLGMPYGIAGGRDGLSEGEVTSILQAAVDLGITALDTSPGFGLAEQRVGAFLNEHDLVSDISVCTKLAPIGSIDAKHLERVVEKRFMTSLGRQRCDCVDCYLIEDVADLLAHGERLIDAMLWQRETGRVLDIGGLVYDPEDLAVAADYLHLNVVQHPYNLLDRRLLHGDWLAGLRSMGTKLQIRSVLLEGSLVLGSDAVPAYMVEARAAMTALRDVLTGLGLSLPEAAVALEADRIIVAARSAAQLEQLLAAVELGLPDGLTEALEARFAGLPRAVYDPRAWLTSS